MQVDAPAAGNAAGPGQNLTPGTAATTITFTPSLWADYIYLDTDERRRFAQVSHEYLIEQVQTRTVSCAGANGSYNINLNHPVKELIITGQPVTTTPPAPNNQGASQAALQVYLDLHTSVPLAATRVSGNITVANQQNDNADRVFMNLKLNGHERMARRPLTYFTRTQVSQYHSGSGGLLPCRISKENTIGVYSFALKPEEHQPSGTCNFSRIDNAQIVFSGNTNIVPNVVVFAVNYNVLRIMSGMGGLAYSN